MQKIESIVKDSRCYFNDYGVRSGLRQKRKLGAFVNSLIATYRKKASHIGYTFVDDEYLYDMNRSHLQHDTYTDIITFDLSDKTFDYLLGDIYISTDRVKENAQSLRLSYQDELLRVILHGALHISGFGDKTKKRKRK
ncbi:endoribonuclease YbeY [Filimonas sp.]|nr:endoribonuclease YbeY [Filimonas sp.]